MNKKLLLGGLLLLSTTLWGVPAKRGYHTMVQPDGSLISVQLSGDELLHYYTTLDNQIVLLDSDGFYKYATFQNGQMSIANVIAHNPAERSFAEKQFISDLNQEEIDQTVNILRKSTTAQRSSNMTKAAAFPTSGEVHGLVLLVQFQDVKFTVSSPLATFENHMNQENYSLNDATGSARDYFISQSSGVFTPKFDVIGPITVSQNMVYYGGNDYNGNDSKPAYMVKEACEIAAADFGVDFSKYDLDNNALVDLVYVIYAGYGEAQGGGVNTIWPHAWDITAQKLYLKLNGKSIRSYACSSELSGNPNSGTNLDGIGTFCHEFSHCLGLPDMYDTSYSGQNFGMGEWDVMDTGSYNNDSKTPPGYSAFEKASIGWTSLTELKESQKVTLEELHKSNQAYAIYSDVNRNEYFVFENRQKTGWDAYLPGNGLLITHIDYLQSAWDNNNVNNTVGHQRVTLVPADNKLLMYTGNNSDAYVKSLAGDPYPGTSNNTSFTDFSTPAADLYTGGKLGKPVTKITHENQVVTFEFMSEFLNVPQILPASHISETGFTANWSTVAGASSYSLKINEIKGGEIIVAEDFNKMSKGSIAQPDASDISSKLNSYMNTPGWTGSKLYQAGGICKFGSNSVTSGTLISPELDFSMGEDKITIYYTAQGKSDCTNGISFMLTSNAAGTSVLKTSRKDLTSEFQRDCIVFENVPNKAYLKIQTSIVGYLDDLKIYAGDVSLAEPKAITRAISFPSLIEEISSTSYEVTGLTPGNTYSYQVMANKNEIQSEWSSYTVVTTNMATNIITNAIATQIQTIGNKLIITAEEGLNINIYNMNGISVYTGNAIGEPITINCQKGIYLVKVGNNSSKILIAE